MINLSHVIELFARRFPAKPQKFHLEKYNLRGDHVDPCDTVKKNMIKFRYVLKRLNSFLTQRRRVRGEESVKKSIVLFLRGKKHLLIQG
jgi:RNA binding exosome subunit